MQSLGLGTSALRSFVPKQQGKKEGKTYEPQSAYDHWIFRPHSGDPIPAERHRRHQVQRRDQEVLEGRSRPVAGEDPMAQRRRYMESKVLVNSQLFLKPVGCEKRVGLRKVMYDARLQRRWIFRVLIATYASRSRSCERRKSRKPTPLYLHVSAIVSKVR